MNIIFSQEGWTDLQWWLANADRKSLKRLSQLIDDVSRNAFSGIGKPEPLKGNLSGFWSRRIDGEHRLIYRVLNDAIEISSCKDHY